MTRWKRIASLSIVAVIVVSAAVWWLKPVGRDFDKSIWHDQTKVKSGARAGMADRLIARRTLIGMSRDQVVAMLGPPEERSSEMRIVYNLGPERGLISVDGELLYVELDEHGKVTRCRIITT